MIIANYGVSIIINSFSLLYCCYNYVVVDNFQSIHLKLVDIFFLRDDHDGGTRMTITHMHRHYDQGSKSLSVCVIRICN